MDKARFDFKISQFFQNYLVGRKTKYFWNNFSSLFINIEGSIVNASNRLNGIFNSFIPFSSEFSPGNRLIDIFSSHFSFHLSNRKYAKAKKTYLCKLDELIFYVSVDLKTAVIVSDASIKNQVTMFIAHIHVYKTPVVKIIHHTINVTSTKAELFAIRCGLN